MCVLNENHKPSDINHNLVVHCHCSVKNFFFCLESDRVIKENFSTFSASRFDFNMHLMHEIIFIHRIDLSGSYIKSSFNYVKKNIVEIVQ